MKKISRRSFLLAAVVSAAAGVLTACGGSSNDKDTAAKITSIDQLYEGKKIGVQLGTTGDIYATDDFGADNVEQYNKGADAVQALKTGKVDAVIIDNEPAKSFVAVNDDLTILEALEEESGSEASAAELIHLIELVEEHDLPAIFTETNGSTAAAAILARECGIGSCALDMAMAGDDYFEAMYHNIDTIKEALG